jgi:REP element-mobilizing transposase RayT
LVRYLSLRWPTFGLPAERPSKQSGHEASRILWAKDYFDRRIRNRYEWEKVIRYVERNPVKAGLRHSPEDWE